MKKFVSMFAEQGVSNSRVLCKCRIRLIATVILFAALTGAFFNEHVAFAQEACDCVDVALTMEYLGATWTYPTTGNRRIGTSGSNRKMDVTVMNLGTRTAHDVEVVVDIVKPENSLWFRVPAVPIGRITSMGVATPAGTTSASAEGGYSIHWLIPELPGQASAKFEASASVYDSDISKNPAVQTVNVSHDSMEFFGNVTTSSFERDDRKGNNSERIWAHVTAAVSDNSYPAYGDYSIRSVSVDNPNPSPGDTVKFTVEAGAGSGAMIDMRVDIDLTDGLTVDTGGTISYTPANNRAASVGYADGVFNIGSPKPDEARGAHSVTLPVIVASDATVSDQCLTATVTGNPPPGEGRPYSDDASDNVEKLCLGAPPAEEPFMSGPVDAFTVYPCVGVTDAPCDSANDIRVRAVDASGFVRSKGTAVIWVDGDRARIYDGHTNNSNALQSVNNGNTISWQTAVDPDRSYSGLTAGVELYYSRTPYAGTSGWGGLTFGITAKGADGSSAPPGKVFLRSTSSGNEIRKAESPDYQELRTTPVGSITPATKVNNFLEFEKLGTYKFTWHAIGKRSSLHGSENCNPDSNNVNQVFCASETYTFHVGPMAEVMVEDGGASPHVDDNQHALTIVAVNSGPTASPGARVTGLPTSAEVIHISEGGRYDPNTGVWNTGELEYKDRSLSKGRPGGVILVLSAAAGDTASVSIASEDYEVCIGPKSNPVELAHTTKATCEAVTNASWNSTPVYDYKTGNNTATITAARGNKSSGEGTPTLLETLGHPDYIILLKWQPVATLNGLKVSRYEVQKWVVDDKGKGDWKTQDSEVSANQWVDETPRGAHAKPEDVPQYRVRAVNEAGVEGPWSEAVSWAKQLVEGAGVEVDLDPDKSGIQHERTVKEGEEIEYSIRLTGQPSFMVHIYASGSGLTFVPPPVPPHHLPLPDADTDNLITFHPAQWDEVKTVKVRIDESLEIDGAREVKIAHSLAAPGGINRAAGYGNVAVSDLTLTVEDTTVDKVGFKSLGKQTLLMLASKSQDYIVQPTVRPTKEFTITLESSDEDVAIIDTDLNTAGNQDKIAFRPEDFRAERVTLDDGTEVYASPVSQSGPGRVRVTGVGAGEATISISAVTGDFNFSSKPDSWTGADQAVEVGMTEDSLSAPSFGSAPANQAATVGQAFSYTAPAATDPDNDTITYTASLAGGDALPTWLSFTPSSRAFSGTPQVCDAPASLTITVTATDNGPIPQSASVAFTLTVTGTLPGHQTVSAEDYTYNDPAYYNRPPLFLEGATTTRSLTENSAAGTKVGAPVLACDPDGDTLRYIALDGADGAAFALDENTGQLTTKAGETYDYEMKTSYNFLVIVAEQDSVEGYLSAIEVTVNLGDVAGESGSDVTGDSDTGQQQAEPANRAPAFDSGIVTALAVDENSTAGTKVGAAFTATDPDTDDTLTYSLTGTDAAAFAIGSSTGQIATKSSVAYNYEGKSSYSLAVVVSDGKLSDSTPVTVSLNDVNEAPAFDSGIVTALKVDENSAAGTKVGAAFTATDPDTGATLTYTLTGTDAASFAIGSSTGQITTKTGVTYNYEAKSSYSLAVDVSDGKLSNSTPVTVSLNDVAEAPTVSDKTQFKNHAAKVGEAFSLTLPAADANSGDGGPYEYLLWHRGAGKNFSDQAINGLSFNASTRTLSGTPTAAGVWKLSYVVHDNDSDRGAADRFRAKTNLQITVSP